ncbi:MAG: DUF5011 domain-containing protein [Lachnospiraceae bacterium]|nr:DUF5011 domain-containing protein [Lachnospiraceae bacterium]
MKKWLFGAGIVLCLGLGGAAVYQKMNSDHRFPEISIAGDITYQDGMSEEELLQGVTAWDEQDGDVSDSLVVETVITNTADHTTVIYYAARDKENNVSRASRTAKYQSPELAAQTEGESEAEDASNGETSASSRPEVGLGVGLESGTTYRFSGQETEEESESETETEPESESEEMEPGQPVLRLSSLSATMKAGEIFNPLSYVASIEDDYDNSYELWRNIQVEGEYDTEKPGRYELTYYVVDSSGNMSNRARFLLRVTDNENENE